MNNELVTLAELAINGSDLTGPSAVLAGIVIGIAGFGELAEPEAKISISFTEPTELSKPFSVERQTRWTIGRDTFVRVQIIQVEEIVIFYLKLNVPNEALEEAWIIVE